MWRRDLPRRGVPRTPELDGEPGEDVQEPQCDFASWVSWAALTAPLESAVPPTPSLRLESVVQGCPV